MGTRKVAFDTSNLFPKLRVCAAHLGGFRQRKYALDVLADRNVWMDTSSCM